MDDRAVGQISVLRDEIKYSRSRIFKMTMLHVSAGHSIFDFFFITKDSSQYSDFPVVSM